MTPQTASAYGLMLASLARIEAMKADNAVRAANNEAPAYTGNDFRAEANHLEHLAHEVIRQ